MKSINIEGLRGTIYQRGKDSWRVQLSLGKSADGKYKTKRETIRGTKQQAIDLLTRWNVDYLDNALTATNYQTVDNLCRKWLDFVEKGSKPNTLRFYKERWDKDILPEIGRLKIKDVNRVMLQDLLDKHPSKSAHNKRAVSAFYGYCVKYDYVKENPCNGLRTLAKPKKQTEDDVWNVDQIKKVYEVLSFRNLYDIFIVFGLECGLRPQETMALTWDGVKDDAILVEEAVIDRSPDKYTIGEVKTESSCRFVFVTPYLRERLIFHQLEQDKLKAKNKNYVDKGLVIADKNGSVPDLKYIRRYMIRKAKEIGVPQIPPKNLRSTYISLMCDLGVPLSVLQKQVGHTSEEMIKKHYLRLFKSSLQGASNKLHDLLHP